MQKTGSSFKKITQNKSDDKMYFGQKQFDSIFQNQLKKGLLIFMQEDYPSKMHIQFSRYFIGSHHHMQLPYKIYDDNLDWSNLVPSKTTSKSKESQSQAQNQIAWRYNENTTSQTIGAEDDNIPELDLQSHVEIANNAQNFQEKNFRKNQDLETFFNNLVEQFENQLKDEKDQAPRKILIRGALENRQQQELAKFFQNMKYFTNQSHTMILISFHKINQNIRNIIDLFGDLVFNVENILENDDYEDFEGILRMTKLPQFHSLSPLKLDTLDFGIKAKSKRKLVIERLYLAPDKEEQQETICTSKPQNNSMNF